MKREKARAQALCRELLFAPGRKLGRDSSAGASTGRDFGAAQARQKAEAQLRSRPRPL